MRTAADGEEALAQVEAFQPELIFMDLAMPRLDGVAATRRIRALPQCQRVRIVALTGWGQATDRQRTREAGMDHHLIKPVSLDDLRKRIDSIDDDGARDEVRRVVIAYVNVTLPARWNAVRSPFTCFGLISGQSSWSLARSLVS